MPKEKERNVMICIECDEEFRKDKRSIYRQGEIHNLRTGHENFTINGRLLYIDRSLP